MASNADNFRRMHAGPSLLILPNCWDAGSARVLERAGAPALATTSAGVAWSNGYRDGGALPARLVAAVAGAIARVVTVPLSVDIESGYSTNAEHVGELVAALLDVGVAGVNIEDGTDPPDVLAAKIEHARRVAARRATDLFVNARTDVYLRELVAAPARVEETLVRAKRYKEAGADGLFVPMVSAANEIRLFASSVGMPLNVLASPELPMVRELALLGVRRLSAGSALAQLALGRAARAAEAFLRDGHSDSLAEEAIAFQEMNALFRG